MYVKEQARVYILLNENNDMGKLSKKMDAGIYLLILIIVLFIFDRESAINFVKILITYILSSRIVKDDFSHLIIKLSDYGNGRICEYTLRAVFTSFIFLEIEFLLNRMYTYTLLAFIFLLVFAGIALHLIARGEIHQTVKDKKQSCEKYRSS